MFSGANFIVPRERFLEVLWADDWHWYGYDDYEFFDRWYTAGYSARCVEQSIAYHLEHPIKDGDPIAYKEWLKRRDELKKRGKEPYLPLTEGKKWLDKVKDYIK